MQHTRHSGIAGLFVVAVLAWSASSCARAHANTAPVVPDAPLTVPAPPPRDIETIDVEPLPPPAPAPEPPRTTTPAPRPRPAPPREQPRPEPPKPEPPPDPPKPAEEPARSPTLQTTPATAEGELERTVRATLTRATNELNRVDYRTLNADARTQYDTAKRFIRQADDAVRAKNLTFAKNLADKAAVISAQLRAR